MLERDRPIALISDAEKLAIYFVDIADSRFLNNWIAQKNNQLKREDQCGIYYA